MSAMSSSENPFAFDAVIHPYRSLGAYGFGMLLAVVVGFNVIGAIFMLSHGAWPVVGFMGLDVLAVYVAFRLSYAQARAFERVTIDETALRVERVDPRGLRREWSFPSYWVNVFFEGDEDQGTVIVRSHGRSLEIGAFLAPFERKSFADALREALRAAKTSPLVAQA